MKVTEEMQGTDSAAYLVSPPPSPSCYSAALLPTIIHILPHQTLSLPHPLTHPNAYREASASLMRPSFSTISEPPLHANKCVPTFGLT